MKSPEEHRDRNIGENDQIVVDKGDAEELLPGWKKEVKVRKIGSRTKTDRYYTDPVTGYTFRSFKDVQRYLKTGEVGKLAIKPKPTTGPCKKIVAVSDVKLPEAVKLEEKTMVSSPVGETSRLKRPLENGYKTRSKSGETGKFESPPRASKRLAGVGAPPPPSPPEFSPKTRHATKLAGIKIETFEAPPPSSPPVAKTRHATQLAGIKIDASPPPSVAEPKTRQARRLAGMEIDASPPPSLPEPKTRSARRMIEMETDTSPPPPPPPPPPEPKTRKATRLAGTETGAPPLEPKTRQATRLAGMKIGSPLEPKTSHQETVKRAKEPEPRTTANFGTPKETEKISELEKITEKDDRNATLEQETHEKITNDDFNPNEKQEPIFPPKEHYKEIETGPTTAMPPAPPPPLDFGIQTENTHHGKQESLPVVNPIPQDMNTKPESSSMNFCLNDFWTDPCIEFAVKTLTGAIPFGDLNNKADSFAATPLEVPLNELWTDPCIEFAVKTLTGVIPVGEEDYLQPQPSSSRSENRSVQSFSLPDVGMNFCQTEVLSKHFDSNKQQQDLVGNGGLQKPGVGQGSSSNINGQCSRSFF